MRRGGGVGYDFSPIARGCFRARHAVARERADIVHARVRPELETSNPPARGAAHRWEYSMRPPGHRGIHPRQGPRRAGNFNMSVTMTAAFMRAVESDGESNLATRPRR